MSSTPAVLAAAAGVALGHAVLPDHWVPLAVVGRTRRYPLRRVARLSILAGVAHVALSLLLGAVIVVVGLQLRSLVEGAQNLIVGGVLVATGLGFLVLEVTGRGHHRADHDHEHDDDGDREDEGSTTLVAAGAREQRAPGLAAVMVPFGAAASPDLTILPVFLAATTVGAAASIAALVVFSSVTILTIVGLTLAATFAGFQIRGGWLERWGNRVTAFTLVVIGGLVATGVI
jgi:nickel/cobalt transporter (NicO) family protein